MKVEYHERNMFMTFINKKESPKELKNKNKTGSRFRFITQCLLLLANRKSWCVHGWRTFLFQLYLLHSTKKRIGWKRRLEGCQLGPDPFKFVVCKKWKDPHCFFNVSTDFCSNSSLAAISFFTLASNSSAPLRRAKGKQNGIKLLTSWLERLD